jgi:hypothetical protein
METSRTAEHAARGEEGIPQSVQRKKRQAFREVGQHRYNNAACCAALAAASQGRDAEALADGERAALQRQALTWLRAHLDAWRRCLTDGNPSDRADAEAMLRHWGTDPDLSGVRHP